MPYKDPEKKRIYDQSRNSRSEVRERRKKTNKLWLDNNKNKVLKVRADWRRRNPDKVRRMLDEWRRKNPEKDRAINRRYKLKNEYGLTEAEVRDMAESQGWKCDICGDKLVEKEGRAYYTIDHCHRTGKNRGLLCHKCNRGIGFLNDDITIVEKAVQYLRKHS